MPDEDPESELEISLKSAAEAHFTAIEQYTCQSAHMRARGYPKLADYFQAEVDDERVHLARILARLEFYDIGPEYEHPVPEWPRHDVRGMFEANLVLEEDARDTEKWVIKAARAFGDEVTALAIAENLEGTESSILEINATLRIIGDVTIANYLANQI